MGGSRSHSGKKLLENSPNCPILLLIYWQWGCVPCVFCLYTLLKVVCHYDLRVSDGFPKTKVWIGWWVGGVSSFQVLFWNFPNYL